MIRRLLLKSPPTSRCLSDLLKLWRLGQEMASKMLKVLSQLRSSFVSPKWVPQLADSGAVLTQISRLPGVSYPVLVPNMKGLTGALEHNVTEIGIFTAASEAFCKKNINCSIEESFERFLPTIQLAKERGVAVRGYVSCVAGCPYQGEVDAKTVAMVSERLLEMGCFEVSLGDTIGVGTPAKIKEILTELGGIPFTNLALHCHDTYGQALANVSTGLDMGIRVFDSSVSGLGGCPYARGASGNVATEDLLYLLEGAGAETG
eukprot:sb/3468450/